LLLGDARCLGGKRIEMVEFILKLRMSREESGQRYLVWMFGLSHAGSKRGKSQKPGASFVKPNADQCRVLL